MLQFGIIGMGRIGKVHLQSISHYVKNAVVKAVADPFMTEETSNWAKSFGVKMVSKDYHDIINDSGIDAVLICSSTDTHAPISIEAIEAGKSVFCEKPISHDISEIKKVMAALEKTELKYQVGFNRRFDHNFKAIHDAVKSGAVGEPEIIKISSRDPEPPSAEYVKVSGGMFLDMTIHDFDMARYLVGSDVEEVYVQSAVLIDPAIGKAGDVDTAIISMKMSNGALAVIDNCRRSAYGYDQRAEVFGSKGMVSIGNDANSNMKLSDSNGVICEKPLLFFLERYMNAYADELISFTDSIENNKPTIVNALDGLQAVRIGIAAGKSVKEHRPVKLSEIES